MGEHDRALLYLLTTKTNIAPFRHCKQQKSVGRDGAHIALVPSGVEIRIRARLEGVPKDAPEKEGFSRCRGHSHPQL